MLFVFPLICSHQHIGGRPMEIKLLFNMARWMLEMSLFPFISTHMAPRHSDTCLDFGNRFDLIS